MYANLSFRALLCLLPWAGSVRVKQKLLTEVRDTLADTLPGVTASLHAVDTLGVRETAAMAMTTTTTTTIAPASEIEQPSYPTLAEYDKFRYCLDLDADLHEIVAIGQKVFRYRDDPAWPTTVGLNTVQMKFLHPYRREKSVLREKMASPLYVGQKLQGNQIAIIGGGPSGLRLGIELALHGAQVHVLEKRAKFNRYNVLKLWPFTNEDIISLGGRVLYAKFTSYQVKRIPIAVLQHVLMRIALALGVSVHPECAVNSFDHSDTTFTLDPRYSCPTRAQFQSEDYDAVFDATGTLGVLRDSKDEADKSLIGAKTKRKELLGLTMNFKRFGQTKENKYYYTTREDPRFSKHNPAASSEAHASKQYDRLLFESKHLPIENWVYWKADASHYIVVTLTRDALVAANVVPENNPKVSTSKFLENLDRDKLVTMGLTLAEEWNFPRMCFTNGTFDASACDASAFVVNAAGNPDVAIFDFGTTKTAKRANVFLQGRKGQNVYVGVVGDAIKTPFWPFGTGANHAFYSAYLQTWALLAWKGYDYGDQGTSALSKKMLKDMLAMPVEGNAVGFNKRKYEELINKNYAAIAAKQALMFY